MTGPDPGLVFNKLVLAEPLLPAAPRPPTPAPGQPEAKPRFPWAPPPGPGPTGTRRAGLWLLLTARPPGKGSVESGEAAPRTQRCFPPSSIRQGARGKRQGPPSRVWYLVGNPVEGPQRRREPGAPGGARPSPRPSPASGALGCRDGRRARKAPLDAPPAPQGSWERVPNSCKVPGFGAGEALCSPPPSHPAFLSLSGCFPGEEKQPGSCCSRGPGET